MVRGIKDESSTPPDDVHVEHVDLAETIVDRHPKLFPVRGWVPFRMNKKMWR